MAKDTPNHEMSTGFIEADEDLGYETNSSAQSETTSSLQEWLVENGRRYHAYYGPDKNMMPTDEIEQERLDIHHEILLLIANGDLYKAPVGDAARVLDLGTGTGIWAVDYATEHPEAEVIGLDLSPIQPNWVPPNCRFEVDDFELEWTYKADSFDFIHARNICHSVKKWPVVLSEVMKHLKPGCWFELAELGAEVFSDDSSVPDTWPPKYAFDLLRESLETLGRINPTGKWLEKLLNDAGFVDIELNIPVHVSTAIIDASTGQNFQATITPWPKRKDLKQAGALLAMQTDTGYHAYMMSLLTRTLGWTSEDANAFCKSCHAAHLDRKSGVHAYNKFYIGYGRKPE